MVAKGYDGAAATCRMVRTKEIISAVPCSKFTQLTVTYHK